MTPIGSLLANKCCSLSRLPRVPYRKHLDLKLKSLLRIPLSGCQRNNAPSVLLLFIAVWECELQFNVSQSLDLLSSPLRQSTNRRDFYKHFTPRDGSCSYMKRRLFFCFMNDTVHILKLPLLYIFEGQNESPKVNLVLILPVETQGVLLVRWKSSCCRNARLATELSD